jgi:hypothetical protein
MQQEENVAGHALDQADVRSETQGAHRLPRAYPLLASREPAGSA